MKKLRLLNFSIVIALLLSSIATTPTYALTDKNKATVPTPLINNQSSELSVDNLKGNSTKITGFACAWCMQVAYKMFVRGVANSIIKSFLKRYGFSCPSFGPFWLCAKRVY